MNSPSELGAKWHAGRRARSRAQLLRVCHPASAHTVIGACAPVGTAVLPLTALYDSMTSHEQALQPVEAPALTLAALPDELVVRILAALSQEDRQVVSTTIGRDAASRTPGVPPAASVACRYAACSHSSPSSRHAIQCCPCKAKMHPFIIFPCRFQHAALVCKRFRALCLSPALLHSVSVRAVSAPLPRYRALLSFLAAQAKHVRCLELRRYAGSPFPGCMCVCVCVRSCLLGGAKASRERRTSVKLCCSPACC